MIMPKDRLFLSNTDMIARRFVEQRCMRWMEREVYDEGECSSETWGSIIQFKSTRRFTLKRLLVAVALLRLSWKITAD